MTTRREFLVTCSTLAIGGGLNPTGLLATPIFTREVSLERLGFEGFSKQLKSTFRVRPEAAPTVGLELAEAEVWQPSGQRNEEAEDAGYEKFSLLFRGPREQRLEQGLHMFEHPAMGRFGLFIVPVISRDQGHTYYEAVFNRPKTGFGQQRVV